MSTIQFERMNLKKKKNETWREAPWHIGDKQTSVKPSNQNEIVKIPVEDSLPWESSRIPVHPIDRPRPLSRENGKTNVDIMRTDGAARCTRNERERRLDSTLGNTIYWMGQVYEEQIPPRRHCRICRYSSRSEIERLLVARRSRRNAVYLER